MREDYILHLPKWYPNQKDDLEGIFVQRHILSTNPYIKSHVLFLKISDAVPAGRYYYFEEALESGIRELKVYYSSKIISIPFLDKLAKALLYFYLFIKFYSKIQKLYGKPILIHAHIMSRTAFCAWIIRLIYSIPYILTEHNTFFISETRPNKWNPIYWIKKILVSKASALITVSKDLELGMKKFGFENRHPFRIFNNVDCTLFKYETKTNVKDLQILHVSEFKNAHKNITGILEGLKLVQLSGLDFHFHLVGYGIDLGLILDQIKTLRLSDKISFHGKLKGEDLAKLYQEADVFVLFSNKENMPCVIAESLCCGTPVISTPVGGIPEVINSSNGFLTPVGDSQQLSALLLHWAESRISFDRWQIAREAKALFSNEAIGLSQAQIYSDILNRNITG